MLQSSQIRFARNDNIPNAEIVKVQFGILSSKEIEQRSAVEVTESNLRRTGVVQRGSVNDPMLGPTGWSQLCGTCVNDMISCPGHSGHMNLGLPVINAEFVSHVHKILLSVCFWCCRLMVPEDFPRYDQVMEIQNPKKRLERIKRICEDRQFCESWGRSLQRRRKQHEDFDVPERGYCGGKQPKVVKADKITFEIHFELDEEDFKAWKRDTNHWEAPMFTPRDLRNILNFINNESVQKLGYNPEHAHPRNMMWDNFYVPPVTIRPSKGTFSHRSRKEEDLTLRLKNIVKYNQLLKAKLKKADAAQVNLAVYHFRGKKGRSWKRLFQNNPEPVNEGPCLVLYLQLARFIATYQNAKLKGKGIQYGREKKCLRHIFRGQKSGRVRRDVVGKREDQCARSVITPDPFMHINQVGIPQWICMKLTYPERVCAWNIHRLTEAVRKGPDQYPGANYIEDGVDRIGLQFVDRNSLKLQLGWTVYRHLVNGDYVLFNRQPTLHKPSIVVHKIHVVDGDSFRLHLAVTPGFNADFDGDEMNCLPLLSPEVRAEGKNLMLTENCMLKDGSPIVQFVQHSLVGLYLLSDPKETIPRDVAMHILFQNAFWDVSRTPPNTEKVSGLEVLACVFPSNLYVKRDGLRIEKGMIKEGRLTKKTVNGHQGLLHVLVQDYGGPFAADFVSGMYVMLDAYLSEWKGLTMSVDDCEVSVPLSRELAANQYLQAAKTISTEVSENSRNKTIVENNVCALLDHFRDIRGDAALQQLNNQDRRNGMCEMVYSGAKGNPTNIVQISACLGQQRNDRSRRPPLCTSHFDQGKSVEGHGMITSNFLNGCSPIELFFHAMSSRAGLVDTAVRTAETGYAHRRIAKALEDACVDIFGTVRNGNKEILQMVYAGDGFDPNFLERVTLRIPERGVQWYQDRHLEALWKKMETNYFERLALHNHWLESVWCPVAFPRLFRQLQCEPDLRGSPVLSKYEIETRVDDLWRYMVNHHELSPTLKIELLYFEWLSFRSLEEANLIETHLVEALLDRVHTRFVRGRITPGEAVGHIAAQCIGEPVTQMSLNSFHKSGLGTELTTGVARVKEIINASKHPSTPSMRVFLHEEDVEDLYEFGVTLIELKLQTLVDRMFVYLDPDWPTQEDWMSRVRQFQTFFDQKEMSRLHPCSSNAWIRLTLDRDQCIHQLMTPPMIVCSLLKTFPTSSFAWSELEDPSWWVLLAIPLDDPKVKEIAHAVTLQHPTYRLEQSPRIVLQMYGEFVQDYRLRGIEGIEDFCVSSAPRLRLSPEGKVEPTMSPFILTRGSNLAAVLALDEVDIRNTMSTHIREVYNVFGIDATCAVIEYELLSVLLSSGASVQSRHIQLLAERMCRSGDIEPTTYSGICQTSSVLRNASFENTMESFLGGAAQGYTDPCNGVTECVMVNRRAQVGSGLVEVFQEPDAIPASPSLEAFFEHRSGKHVYIAVPTHKNLDYYLKPNQTQVSRKRPRVTRTSFISRKRPRKEVPVSMLNEKDIRFAPPETRFRPWEPAPDATLEASQISFAPKGVPFRPWTPPRGAAKSATQ